MAYSQENIEILFNKICEEISKGNSLRKVLLNQNMPDQNTFYKWIDNNVDKKEQYARACHERQEVLFEEIIEISDNNEGLIFDEFGNKKMDSGFVQLKKLKIDTRKWMLGKMNPKKFGDKIQQEHSGEIKTTPSSINVRIVENIEDDE